MESARTPPSAAPSADSRAKTGLADTAELMKQSFLAFEAGHVTRAAQLLESLPKDLRLGPAEARRAAQITGSYRMLKREPAIPRRWPPAYEPVPRTLLYVTSFCQPFHLSGYSVRTQALLEAAATTAWKVTCMTRPGYPWDRMDALATTDSRSSKHGGIEYRHARGAHISMMPPDAYVATASTQIEAVAREVRPSIIQAASNHLTALPALIAARRLGIPFVYEVRGFWEVMTASVIPGYEQSERFVLARRLESLAARNADAVFTLTRQLADELEERGVDRSRIHLLPNGANVGARGAEPRDRSLLAGIGLDPEVFTIAYAGGIKYYEGIDDLLEALALLRREGKRAQAVIVGDGDQLDTLRARSSQLQLDGAVRFLGRRPQPIAHAYLRAADIAIVPRKRLKVGEMVSPLKALEVMSLGVPLVVSDVEALSDIARDSGGGASLFQASDPASLASRIARDMDEPGERQARAARALQYIMASRSWSGVAAGMAATLDETERRARSRSGPLFSIPKRMSRYLQRIALGEESEPLRQKMAADMAALSLSDAFDVQWYLQRYPDVVHTGMNPYEHYLRHGIAEGRRPRPMPGEA